MSIPDENVPRVLPPVHEEMRDDPARDEPAQWLPFFVAMFVVFVPVQLLLAPRLGLAWKATFGVSLGVAVLAGFLAEPIFDRLHSSPKERLPPDRDQAV